MKNGLIASCCLFAAVAAAGQNGTTLDVPAGKTVKVEPGRLFEGGPLVKTGAGCLDLSGAQLRNAGLEIREGRWRSPEGARRSSRRAT